jgi:hypothetical protein
MKPDYVPYFIGLLVGAICMLVGGMKGAAFLVGVVFWYAVMQPKKD